MPVAAPARVIDLTNSSTREPADPWELQGGAADLVDFTRRRMAAYPRRPIDWDDLPEEGLRQLRAAIGSFGLEETLVVPRSPRPTGAGDLAWVVTPTAVLAVGKDAVGYWVDAAGGGSVVRRLPLAEVAAIVDRTLLLYGRLEIAGPTESVVVRYNTIARQFVRSALREIRRSFWPGVETRDGGPGPREVPLKWTNVLLSTDLLPHGPQPRLVVAGATGGRRPEHQGIAVLTPSELQIAVEPTGDGGIGTYGVDLVVVPRSRLLSLAGEREALRIRVAGAAGDVGIRVPACPELASSAVAAIGPLVNV